ncbi:MAG: hypothetical protein KY392_04115 [Chloroflexi bacterium]|nr:hypothetical protein [Chloroflexota bacterium]
MTAVTLRVMTQIELEISALRARRRTPSVVAWLRRHRPFDRRSIRVPAERDAYWINVQRRLAESDAVSLSRRATERPERVPRHDAASLIGAE